MTPFTCVEINSDVLSADTAINGEIAVAKFDYNADSPWGLVIVLRNVANYTLLKSNESLN